MTLVSVDRAFGCSIDAPTACAIRNPISQPVDGASEQASEPAPKITSPTWNIVRRPIRSPIDPARISNEAATTV
jgi:hypothetical protein